MRASVVFLIALVALGCGGPRGPKTVPVSGIVKLDGRPLEEVDVHFLGEMHAGYGTTDREGKFKLVTGAVVGENRVYFSKIKEGSFGSGDPESGLDEGQARAAAMGAGLPGGVVIEGQSIPVEFSSPDSTKLKFTVPEGGTDSATFDLDTPKK